MIHLFDDWYLDADDRQFVLISWNGKYDKKTGKNKENVSYFYIQKLEKVFDRLLTVSIRRKIAKSEITGIKQLKAEIETEFTKMKALYAGLNVDALFE